MPPPLATEWRSFFKWVLFVGKLAAPLLWRGAVSLLTEGRGAARGLFKMLNKKVVVFLYVVIYKFVY